MARTDAHKPIRLDFGEDGFLSDSDYKWATDYNARFSRYSGVKYYAKLGHRKVRRDRSYLDWDNYVSPSRTGRSNAKWYCM